MNAQKFTSEAVSPWHPDKVADRVSDFVVDYILGQAPDAKVACETMLGHNQLSVIVETNCPPDKAVLTDKLREWFDSQICSKEVKDYHGIHEYDVQIIGQSVEIETAATAGAGDQGIVVGLAVNRPGWEASNSNRYTHQPMDIEIPKRIINSVLTSGIGGLGRDAKCQIVFTTEEVSDIWLSIQHSPEWSLDSLRTVLTDEISKTFPNSNVTINQAGPWTIGGSEADTGLTGRKIVCDQFGPNFPVGGGAFSGKDLTKVDRSGSIHATLAANKILEEQPDLHGVMVRLGYMIGQSVPILVTVDSLKDGIWTYDETNMTPWGLVSNQIKRVEEYIADNFGSYERLAEWGPYF